MGWHGSIKKVLQLFVVLLNFPFVHVMLSVRRCIVVFDGGGNGTCLDPFAGVAIRLWYMGTAIRMLSM